LKNVRLCRDGDKLHVEGSVAGTCAGPLELYVLMGGHQASYQTISAGEAFDITVTEGGVIERGESLRVELVNVATVWHVVEIAADA
jgi:hypothetical protein